MAPTRRFLDRLKQENRTISEPLTLLALVDTGASHTVIQQGLAQKLGLEPAGTAVIATPASAGVVCLRYEARLLFPHQIWVECLVTEAPMEEQEVQALIGRDILSRCILVYLGERNTFTLSF